MCCFKMFKEVRYTYNLHTVYSINLSCFNLKCVFEQIQMYNAPNMAYFLSKSYHKSYEINLKENYHCMFFSFYYNMSTNFILANEIYPCYIEHWKKLNRSIPTDLNTHHSHKLYQTMASSKKWPKSSLTYHYY